MTSQSDLPNLTPKELEDYGFARVRDVAFDAILALWRRRQEEGMKQTDLAKAIGRDTAWISRKLKGPGNWTLRSVGAFVVALDGELEIQVHALEDRPIEPSNYHAYSGYAALTAGGLMEAREIEWLDPTNPPNSNFEQMRSATVGSGTIIEAFESVE